MIDIPPLHQHDLIDHLLPGDRVAGLGADLLTVDPLELDRLPIEVEVASSEAKLVLLCRRIPELYLPKSCDDREGLSHPTPRIEELAHQRVEVWPLCRPESGIAEREDRLCHRGLAPRRAVEIGRHDDAGRAILLTVEGVSVERVTDPPPICCARGAIPQLSPDMERPVSVALVQVGRHGDVPHRHLRTARQVDRAVDTRQAPHILRLEEGAVARSVHLYSHRIHPLTEVVGDVKGGGGAGVLAESHILTIDPEVEERIDPIEVELHPSAAPVCRDREVPPIRAHLVSILIGGPVGRGSAHHSALPVAGRDRVLEDVGLIAVDRRAVLQ